jgi:hypothetical protein
MRIEAPEACEPRWRCPECWATVYVIEEPPLEDSAMCRNEVFVRIDGLVAVSHRQWSGPVMYRFCDVDAEWPEVGLELREVGRAP